MMVRGQADSDSESDSKGRAAVARRLVGFKLARGSSESESDPAPGRGGSGLSRAGPWQKLGQPL